MTAGEGIRSSPFENVGVVTEGEDAEIRGVVDERYQRSEGHGADAGHDSDRERNQAERQETDPPPLTPNREISDGVDLPDAKNWTLR